MKRAAILCFLLFLAVFLLSGCARENGDCFLSLHGDFSADVEGEMNGVPFAARIDAAGADAARRVTITVYAPKEIEGTTLSKRGAGEIELSMGEFHTAGGAAAGFEPLFSLLAAAKEAQKAGKDEEGHTKVTAGEAQYLFLSDGTPYKAQNGAVSLTFVSFSTP